MPKKTVFALFMVFLALTWVFASTPYKISPGDIVEISVYDEPDLTTVARVSYTGEITFPLLKNIKISGFSLEKAENLISQQLKDEGFLKNPQVRVYVKEYAKIRIYVYGAVEKPGTYSFERETPTMLKAISMAGGLTEDAYDTELRIIRKKTESGFDVITVNMKDLIMGVHGKYDVPLKNGDIISIPQSPPVYVFGEVNDEGIINYKKNMRILQAITMAGGFTEKVNRKKIMVLRLNEDGTKFSIINVNFEIIIKEGDRSANITIQPYDIIIAPESWL